MGEFAAKFRPEVDLDEFERRLRAAAPAPQPRAEGSDPLAELARLVGGETMGRKEDPFEALFRAQSAIADIQHAPEAAPQAGPAAGPASQQAPFAHYALREPYFEDRPHDEALPQQEAHGYQEAHAYQGEPYAADQQAYHESDPVWAPEGQAHDTLPQGWPSAYDEPVAPPAAGFRRKVMYGMGAVLVLGVAAIGGTLALRGKSANREVVTIQADSDPAKVKPEQAVNSAAPAGQGLFDRKNNGNVSKVVASTEQPADLGVTVKNARVVGSAAGVETPVPPAPAGATAPAPEAQQDSIFPPAKKVKTVSVRADGTVIDGGDAHAPLTRTLPTMAAGSPAPPVAAAPAPSRTPAAKAPERANSTNEAALKAPAKPAAKEAAKEPAGEGGGFAVQLAGTPNESEARAAVTSLSAKYSSALQGHRPSFVQAKIGDKTVYRVRVGRLTEDSAKSMCGAIKAQGGNCFVAKN